MTAAATCDHWVLRRADTWDTGAGPRAECGGCHGVVTVAYVRVLDEAPAGSTPRDETAAGGWVPPGDDDAPPDDEDGAPHRAGPDRGGLRDVNDMGRAEYEAHRHEQDVDREFRKLIVRETARRRLHAQQAADKPPAVLLADFLAVEDEPVRYRIADVLPVGGHVVLAAQYKAGKTTLVGNLIRSLADGEPFLEAHAVEPTAGKIVLLDAELDERMLRRWMRAHHIQRTDRVAVVSLRGKLSSFDLTDPAVRREWAAVLRDLDPGVVVLDCLRPVLDAIGLDEDKEAGRFLVAFDEMLAMAGASEAVLVHHMGHGGERSRGSSRLRDWPDVEWKLVRKDPEDERSPRYFSAFGRDVDQPERELTYNTELRRLCAWGGEGRRAGALREILDDVCAELEAAPGLSKSAIERRLAETGHARTNVRAALELGVREGRIRVRTGAKNSIEHVLADPESCSPKDQQR